MNSKRFLNLRIQIQTQQHKKKQAAATKEIVQTKQTNFMIAIDGAYVLFFWHNANC